MKDSLKAAIEKSETVLPDLVNDIRDKINKKDYEGAIEQCGVLIANLGGVLTINHFLEI